MPFSAVHERRLRLRVEELTAAVLPLPLTGLLGRDKDLEVLLEWLAEPGARLITLIGPGGVGKSRLALELARLVADHGKLRVLFTSLATIWDPGLAACAIAEALGLADLTAAICRSAHVPRAMVSRHCCWWTISSRCSPRHR